jgi:hypothetical protein
MTRHAIGGQLPFENWQETAVDARTTSHPVLRLPLVARHGSLDVQGHRAVEADGLVLVVPAEPPTLTTPLAQALLAVVAKARAATTGHEPMEGLSSKAS